MGSKAFSFVFRLLLAVMVAIDAANAADDLKQLVAGAEIKLAFRLRYEYVDTQTLNSADALTLRSRLELQSGEAGGISGLLELDDVTPITPVDYHDGVNQQPPPAITDPKGTEINQIVVRFKRDAWHSQIGRQRILLDNQRFVGGVGFRQNEQTYDSLTINHELSKRVNLFCALIVNVNRIFGEQSPVGDHQQRSLLLNARVNLGQHLQATGYVYEIDNQDAALLANRTLGVRLIGSRTLGNRLSWHYGLEFATQSETGDNPSDYTASYYLFTTGFKRQDWEIALGYEILGSDRGDVTPGALNDGRFITPLATLHTFQGWTDSFLAGGTGNIDSGIEDLYLKLSGRGFGVDLTLVYHQFDAETSSMSQSELGSEWGIEVSKIFDRLGFSLKFANYRAEEFGRDTQKLWLTTSYRF